jgi:hypothetical protein
MQYNFKFIIEVQEYSVEVNAQWKMDRPIYPHFIETTSEGYAHCTVYRNTNWEYQMSRYHCNNFKMLITHCTVYRDLHEEYQMSIATTSRDYTQYTGIQMESIRRVFVTAKEKNMSSCSPSISWQWEEAHSRTDLSAILRRIRELILSLHHERLTWTPTRIPA